MSTKIFVNLPVKDLNQSIEFFTRLGYEFNPQFTDENATCMIVAEDIYVMLLVEEFFKSFTNKEIGDTKKSAEVIMGLSAESRTAVDDIVAKAMAAGATKAGDPQDHGWMYQKSFHDLDGHRWEYLYMEEA